jgi:hypothetical protein
MSLSFPDIADFRWSAADASSRNALVGLAWFIWS